MKRVIYIGIAVVALGLASCSKEDIQPNSTSENIVPVWKSLDNENTQPQNNSNSEGGGTIVDPETEEEIANSISDGG